VPCTLWIAQPALFGYFELRIGGRSIGETSTYYIVRSEINLTENKMSISESTDITRQNYITTNPRICHGQVCVKGTRIPISVVPDNLTTGLTPEEVVRSYPTLTIDTLKAVKV